MVGAKYAEIRDLVTRSTFRAALRAELPDSTNFMTAGYVLSIKSNEDVEERYEEIYEEKYATVGHFDIMKDCAVHGSQTIQCE